MEPDISPCKIISYKNGVHGLFLTDAHFTHYDVFDELNREGNGHDWTEAVEQLGRIENPRLLEKLEIDPDAGMFVIRSLDRQALVETARLIQQLLRDKNLLRDVLVRH